ncbi:hypothetical protein [Flavobacterium columnare]|uniref:hypothetical protein n=1 Tax=Flavobacterium covae TaxID=2906076 RepID=UPI000B5C17D1|nr:hypothetical protein B0A56_09125 [Flavobacterium columnare NBRC 100251 = ATCC 23463]
MKEKIFKILDLAIRIYLSISLFGYSISKIFHVQFGNNRHFYLSKKVVELTGQDLTWVFFGFSREYEFCIGLIQLISLILLIFNRTKILGILFLFPIFLNILLIDYFYNIHALYMIVFYYYLLFVLILINRFQIIVILKMITKKNNSWFPKLLDCFFILLSIIILFLFSLVINKFCVF